MYLLSLLRLPSRRVLLSRLSRALLIQTQPVPSPTNLGPIPTADHRTIPLRDLRRCPQLTPTVTLTAVLRPKIRIPLTESGAILNTHIRTVRVRFIRQYPCPCIIRIAPTIIISWNSSIPWHRNRRIAFKYR